MSARRSSTRSQSRSRGPDSIWTLNPGFRQEIRRTRAPGKQVISSPKSLAIFLATISTVSFAAAPEPEVSIPGALPVDQEYPAALPLDTVPVAVAETPMADLPMDGGAANLATPADTALPVLEAEAVDSIVLDGGAENASMLFAGQAVVSEAAPVSEAAREILNPLEQASAKRWSGSIFAGYAWDENPRIDDGSLDEDEDSSGDSILQTGINLSYLLMGGKNSQLSFNGGYNYDFYADNSDLNGDSVNASLSGVYSWERTYLNLSATWNRANGANRIVTDEISSDSVTLNLGLARELTDKVRLTGGANTSYNSFEDYLGSESYGFYAGTDYAFSAKTRLGLQYRAGITQQDDSEDQTYQGVDLTVAWNPTTKLNFDGSIGYQERSSDSAEFESDGPGLVFALSSAWQITPKTSINLRGSRDTVASPLETNSNIYTTRVDMGVTWRISDRFSWNTSAGYSWDDYEGSTGIAGNESREDRYWNLRNNLSWSISGPWSVNFFYEYRDNASNRQGSSYEGQRAGANLSYNF